MRYYFDYREDEILIEDQFGPELPDPSGRGLKLLKALPAAPERSF
jgi:hypothetical protein